MKWIKVKFDKYWFRIHAQEGRKEAVTVYLKDGQKTVAWLNFKYDFPMTKAFQAKNGVIILNFPANMFTPIMETLRVEKPLYVHFHTEMKWGYVGSSYEPVGEQEMEMEKFAALN